MAGIVVKPRARIFHGHDWIFSGEVLKVYTYADDPTNWALTNLDIAYAKRELAKISLDPTEKLKQLYEAVTLSRKSETVLKPNPDDANQNQPALCSPLNHATALQELGDSCYELSDASPDVDRQKLGKELGCASTDLDRKVLINDAIGAYQKALDIWRQYDFPYYRQRTDQALTRANAAL